MVEGAKSLFRDGLTGMRLSLRLPSFLKKTLDPEQARTIIKQRVERRSVDFLIIIKRCIYDRPENPYMKILHNAGCEYGDIQKLVTKEGVEGTLQILFKNGIYLTSKELRGARETVRGNLRMFINPQKVRNPFAKLQIPVRSSGSRSSGTHITRSLEFAYDNMAHWIVSDAANSILSSERAVWIVPGGVALNLIIKLNLLGAPPKRWFSQLDLRSRKLDFRYRMGARILRFSGWVSGVPMPKPEYVSLEDPSPILDWIQDLRGRGRTPHLYTLSSSAVRLAQRAKETGKDLRGVHLHISGEPITKARLETIRRSHATWTVGMGCVELGSIGIGCLCPEAPDDIHLAKDIHAVIQPGDTEDRTDLEAQSLLFSSLRLSSPLVLLNASLGDRAALEKRSCGCLLEDLGLDTHLHHIRSFEKLTSRGMALQDIDVIRILEERLPEKFGGGPTDYQFYEGESEDGTPRLRLYVHPAVGPLDENLVKEVFLQMIGEGSGADKITALLWKSGNILSIERAAPQTTATGKIQHIHAIPHR